MKNFPVENITILKFPLKLNQKSKSKIPLLFFGFLIFLKLVIWSDLLATSASIDGQTIFCRGDTIRLDAFPKDITFKYHWSSGDTTDWIKVSHPGTYQVIIINGAQKDTASINISESEKPKITILAEGSTRFCEGDSINLKTVGVSSFYKWQDYYFENFETNKSYQEWSTKLTKYDWQNPIKRDSNEKPQKRFLGLFGNQNILLTLKNLPDHDSAEIDFDIYTVGTWDGNAQGKNGPDIFKVEETTQNNLLWQTTFSLVDGSYQSYPEQFPAGFYPPKYGALEEFLLSTTLTYGNCTKYSVKFLLIHSAQQIKVQLSALLKDKFPYFSNECWAIDNFRLKLRTMLDDSINLKYKWSTGDTSKSIIVGKSGLYTVYGFNNDGCSDTASLDVVVFPKPVPVIIGSKILCRNEKNILKTDKLYSGYLWTTGERTDSIEVLIPGDYSVIVTDTNGCSGQADFKLTADSTRPLKIIGDSVYCSGNGHVLSANADFVNYRWSTGETTKEITVFRSGTYTLEAVDTNGCVLRDEKELKDFDYKLSKPINYDFGIYPVGYKPTTVFQLKNTGANQVWVDSIYLKNSQEKIFGFNTVTLTPFLFDTNMLIEIEVSFAPSKKGIFYDTLILASSKPCLWPIEIPLKGLGSVGDTFELFVSLPDTLAIVGAKNFEVPLRAFINTKTHFKNLRYSVSISFNASYYYPERILYADSISDFITNSERTVSMKGIIPSIGSDTVYLARLSGQILLGENSKIPLKINNFLIGDTNLIIRKTNGSLAVTGVCQQNLSIIKSYEKNKLEVRTNPSHDNANIVIQSWETGDFVLNVFNSIGMKCHTQILNYKEANIEKNVSINLNDFSSGIYFISLETPQNTERCVFVITR